MIFFQEKCSSPCFSPTKKSSCSPPFQPWALAVPRLLFRVKVASAAVVKRKRQAPCRGQRLPFTVPNLGGEDTRSVGVGTTGGRWGKFLEVLIVFGWKKNIRVLSSLKKKMKQNKRTKRHHSSDSDIIFPHKKNTVSVSFLKPLANVNYHLFLQRNHPKIPGFPAHFEPVKLGLLK